MTPKGSLTRSCEKTKRPREKLERVKGIEPSYSAWKAAALPLSYTREAGVSPASGPAHAWRFAWRQSYKASPRSVKAACARFLRLPDSRPSLAGGPPALSLCRPMARFISPRSGAMLQFWRLDPPFRFAIYIAFAVLFASGAAWLAAGRLKETPNGEIWQQSAAYLLMVHGGAATVTPSSRFMLAAPGAPRKTAPPASSCSRSTRFSSQAAFGLYYLASEILRPWASNLHIAFGLAMRLLFLAHAKTGRKRA
jgi:hypothetical protein